MDYKKLLEEIRAFLSNCERVRYGELVGAPWPYNQCGPMVYTEPEDILLDQAATAITDLLSRAEAAEAAQETLQKAMAEYKARAEKAETQAQVLETANKILTARITKAECRAERAEKCIAEIKSARDHTRPAYVVDQILEEWRERKEE